MKPRYILVNWPEIQDFMGHPRWSECVFCSEIEGHPCEDSTYAVPEDLYNEIYKLESNIILNKEDVDIIKESAHFISFIAQTEGESINNNHLDEKLLRIINKF